MFEQKSEHIHRLRLRYTPIVFTLVVFDEKSEKFDRLLFLGGRVLLFREFKERSGIFLNLFI